MSIEILLHLNFLTVLDIDTFGKVADIRAFSNLTACKVVDGFRLRLHVSDACCVDAVRILIADGKTIGRGERINHEIGPVGRDFVGIVTIEIEAELTLAVVAKGEDGTFLCA